MNHQQRLEVISAILTKIKDDFTSEVLNRTNKRIGKGICWNFNDWLWERTKGSIPFDDSRAIARIWNYFYRNTVHKWDEFSGELGFPIRSKLAQIGPVDQYYEIYTGFREDIYGHPWAMDYLHLRIYLLEFLIDEFEQQFITS